MHPSSQVKPKPKIPINPFGAWFAFDDVTFFAFARNRTCPFVCRLLICLPVPRSKIRVIREKSLPFAFELRRVT